MSTDLKSVQESLSTLWTCQSVRDDLLAGRQPSGITPDISQSVNKTGILVYSSQIEIGRQDLMQSIYPHCAKVLSRSWRKIVQHYMEMHPPRHYNLNRAAKGFADYLRRDCPDLVARHGFLPELADYEWIELEVMEQEGEVRRGESVGLDNPEIFQTHSPVVNPIIVIRRYKYPVTKIVDWLENDVRLPRRVKKEAISVAVYRDPLELHARFLELGEVAAGLLEKLEQGECSYADLLMHAVQSSGSADPQDTVVKTIELFEEFQNLGVFMGSKKIV